MITKALLWLGVLAAVTLMGCSSAAPVEPTAAPEVVTNTVPTVSVPARAPVVSPEPSAPEVAAKTEPTATPGGTQTPATTFMKTVDVMAPQGETTLAERIAAADVVVRAEVDSVSQVVDSFRILSRGTYQPAVYAKALAYTLTVNEYLKGSGNNEVVAIAIDFFERHSTREAAVASTTDYLSTRDTQWEDREGIFFLTNWRTDGSVASTRQADRYYLGSIRGPMGARDRYSIASEYSKQWLPATSAPAAAAAQTTTEKTYLLDVPRPAVTPPGVAASSTAPTITLTKMKAQVAKIATEIAAGDGSRAYSNCIVQKYAHERKYDYRVGLWKYRDEPPTRPRFSIDSGLAKGKQVNPENINSLSLTSGWLEGDDAALFEVEPVGVVKTLRPLPAGEYFFLYLERYAFLEPCNAEISDSQKAYSGYYVDVTAPGNTVHEAFFDPVTVGSAVKADSTNGTLSPSSYGTTTIESISYESSTVKATFTPATSLTDLQGGSLAFIEEDGTTLTLAVGDATSSGGTLTWSVTTAPWANGDKLMLRITAPAALTGLELSDITLPFAFGTTSYAVTVPYNLTDTTVTATLNPTAKSAVVKLGGITQANGDVFLETIGANTITVEVAGPDGEVAKTYTVTVTREQFDYANPPVGLSVIRVNHDTVAVVYVHNQGARYHNYHSRSVGTEWLDEYTSNKPRDFLSINTSASCGMSEYRARSKASLTDAWGEWSRIFTYKRTERCS